MSFELDGRIINAGKEEIFKTKTGGDFKKSTFVLEVPDGNYQQEVQFELQGKNAGTITQAEVGMNCKVHFDVRGRPYQDKVTGETKWFTNLSAWRVVNHDHGAAGEEPQHMPEEENTDIEDDNPPF